MRVATSVVLLILMLSTVVAQDAPPAKAPKLSLERNYFLYGGAARIGWFKAAIKEVEQDGKTLIQETGSFYASIGRNFDQRPFVITMEGSDFHDADGFPVRSSMTTTSGPQVVKKDIEFGAEKVTVKIDAGLGKPREVVVDCKEKKLYSSIGAWKKLQSEKRVKAGEKFQFDKLDSDNLIIVQETWTVGGSVKRKTRDGIAFEGTEVIVVSSGHVTRMVIDQHGMAWTGTIPGGFTMEATAKIPEDFKAEPMMLEAAMKSDVAVENWTELKKTEVVIAFKHDDVDGIEPLCESNDYHDVSKFDDDKGSGYLLNLKARKLPADFKAPALPMKDLPENVEALLKPTAMCESDDKDLAARATELTKGVTDSREAATKICTWVFAYLKKASGDTGVASAKQAYTEKKGDCTEHAALFVALARAAGLPARSVSGVVYLEDMFGYHAWAEVWLGRWVPVDATVNEVGTSARYVFFGVDEPGETAGTGRVARCVAQQIKPQVQAYELEDGTTYERKAARRFKPAAKPEGESK